jgi:hypothetical protein
MNVNLMDPKLLMTLVAVVIVTVAVIVVLYVGKRRNSTADLRKKFGPEYDRAVREQGSERKAEAKLADRQERVEKLNIRDLDPMERDRFSRQWESVQSRFVDSPRGAVAEADDLVSSLMKTRGYPVSDFDQRAADISVDHPRVVENYRSAHEIALRVGKNGATTEDLRAAMIHYHSLFQELMQAPVIVERMTQNPKTDTEGIRGKLGQKSGTGDEDDAQEWSHGRADRGGIAAGGGWGARGRRLPQDRDQPGNLLPLETEIHGGRGERAAGAASVAG